MARILPKHQKTKRAESCGGDGCEDDGGGMFCQELAPSEEDLLESRDDEAAEPVVDVHVKLFEASLVSSQASPGQ